MKAAGTGIMFGLLAALLAAPAPGAPAPGAPAPGTPQRIVSMGLCTDQLVMLLADPDAILSVHWVTQDSDDSALARQAARYAANHGLAEEVLQHRPDLVFADATNSPLAVTMLERQGVRVVTVPVADTFAGTRANIRQVAAALGVPGKGEALVAAFDRDLAATRDVLAARHYRALVYGANGFSAGVPSLFDDVLTHLGLINIAGRLGQSGWVSMSVEDVIRADPELLILGEYRPEAPSMANMVLEHPALASLRHGRPVVRVPTSLWNCGTPMLAKAARVLAEQVARAEAGPR